MLQYTETTWNVAVRQLYNELADTLTIKKIHILSFIGREFTDQNEPLISERGDLQ